MILQLTYIETYPLHTAINPVGYDNNKNSKAISINKGYANRRTKTISDMTFTTSEATTHVRQCFLCFKILSKVLDTPSMTVNPLSIHAIFDSILNCFVMFIVSVIVVSRNDAPSIVPLSLGILKNRRACIMCTKWVINYMFIHIRSQRNMNIC